MYDELKERCRACSQGCIYPSECSYFDKPPLRCMRQLLSEAADAIEELQQRVEHYHGGMDKWLAAYIAEHDARIAETKRLYNALYECNKKAFELTPLKIVLPEPPKEEAT